MRRSYSALSSDWAAVIQVENGLVLLYFLGMTFFTQNTILNMLIAIMSATFSRQSSNLSGLGKTQKLNMMAEYLKIVNFYQDRVCRSCRSRGSDQASRYLFVVFPIDDEDEDQGDHVD